MNLIEGLGIIAGGIWLMSEIQIRRARNLLTKLIQNGEALSYTPNWLRYPITSAYGWRIHPITKRLSFHNGIDLKVPYGTPLQSPIRGRIQYIDNPIGGKQVRITHESGITFGFAHLSTREIPDGAMVEPGQIFAHSGNSGRSTGPHLHLTLRLNGTPLNPVDVLKGIWL